MEITQPLVLILLSSGAAFSIAGILLYYFPPKKINHWYGYRTSASMRSQERWDFAQKFSTRALILLGLALMAASLVGELIEISTMWGVIIGLGLLFAGVTVLFLKVEKALKDRFGG